MLMFFFFSIDESSFYSILGLDGGFESMISNFSDRSICGSCWYTI